MEWFDLVRARHSVRAFEAQPIEPEKLQAILEAANQAPSAGNLQAYEIYVCRQHERKRALARACLEQTFVAQAPVALVFCTHAERSSERYSDRGSRLYTLQDATIACTYAMLTATALGLATTWVGAFRDEAVRTVIQAPPHWLPVAVLPVGYPAESPLPTSRRRLEDLVHWDDPRP